VGTWTITDLAGGDGLDCGARLCFPRRGWNGRPSVGRSGTNAEPSRLRQKRASRADNKPEPLSNGLQAAIRVGVSSGARAPTRRDPRICRRFRGVSDGTRTRGRLDHNPARQLVLTLGGRARYFPTVETAERPRGDWVHRRAAVRARVNSQASVAAGAPSHRAPPCRCTLGHHPVAALCPASQNSPLVSRSGRRRPPWPSEAADRLGEWRSALRRGPAAIWR